MPINFENKIVEVRKYQPADRSSVRQISCDTSGKGKSDRYYSDCVTYADFITRYYTDFEPESLWVAQADNDVVGYLTGCLDTSKFERIMTRKILPAAISGALSRGAILRMESYQLFTVLIVSGILRVGCKIDLKTYPAHFHINIIENYRGIKIGQQLIERFRQQCIDAGVRGIHVEALGTNLRGRGFFERMGFEPICERPLIVPENKRFSKTFTMTYGWKCE